MPRAITILTEQFADWETGLFNATARLYYHFDTRFATPQGQPVLSSGGMLVTPQLAIEQIDLDGLDVLLLCGGPAQGNLLPSTARFSICVGFRSPALTPEPLSNRPTLAVPACFSCALAALNVSAKSTAMPAIDFVMVIPELLKN